MKAQEIHSNLKAAIGVESRATLDVLRWVREADRNMVYAEFGRENLFEYLVLDQGYSEGSANRRIAAMRLIRDVPSTEEYLKARKLNLCTMVQLQSFFRMANVATAEKQGVIDQVLGCTQKETQRRLAKISPVAVLPRESERAVNEEYVEIKFLANQDLLDKFEKLKDLNSHRDPTRSYAKLFDWLTDEVLFRAKKSHRVPAGARNDVYATDKNASCSYVDPKSGLRCGSTHQLEIDHRTPKALGGSDSPENLRFLCRTHNILEAKKVFGREFMANYIRSMK